jgi:hypothetical protein
MFHVIHVESGEKVYESAEYLFARAYLDAHQRTGGEYKIRDTSTGREELVGVVGG